MVKKFLFKPNLKRKLWAIFGQGFYTKMALFPQSYLVKRPLKILYNLGYDIPYRSWPTVVAIEINAHCNRKCAYCPNRLHDRSGEHEGLLDATLFQKIIDDLAHHNYHRSIYYHIYNEPLLDKRLPQFIEYTRDKMPKSTIDIFTNGDFLDSDLYRTLIAKGADRFLISLHAEKPTLKLRETLRHLSAAERTLTLNVRDVLKDYKDGKDGFFNRGGAINIHRNKKRNRFCAYVLDCNINFKGDVILCCNDFFGEHVFGNVKQRSLSEIWFDEKYMRLRNQITFGYRELEICKRCNA